MQFLEVVTRRHSQILIGCRVVYHLELAKEPILEIRRDMARARIRDEKCAQPFVPKAYDSLILPPRSYVPLSGTWGKCRQGSTSRKTTMDRRNDTDCLMIARKTARPPGRRRWIAAKVRYMQAPRAAASGGARKREPPYRYPLCRPPN